MSAMSTRIAEQFTSREQQTFAGTFGMWVFIASEFLFFAPLLFGYLYLRTHYPQACAIASRHTDFLLGTANTAVLLSSSFLMALAAQAAEGQRRARAARLLLGVAARTSAIRVRWPARDSTAPRGRSAATRPGSRAAAGSRPPASPRRPRTARAATGIPADRCGSGAACRHSPAGIAGRRSG